MQLFQANQEQTTNHHGLVIFPTHLPIMIKKWSYIERQVHNEEIRCALEQQTRPGEDLVEKQLTKGEENVVDEQQAEAEEETVKSIIKTSTKI